MTGSLRHPIEAATSASARSAPVRWLVFVLPLAVLTVLVVLSRALPASEPDLVGAAAPAFTLPTSDGGATSLDELAADGDVLLFFSMGVGCDGCFWQVTELADGLAERGITMAAIMVDDPETLAVHAERTGLAAPILADADAAVSAAYGMLGRYGHADVPSHSFALVRDGEIAWARHYSEMFVPADRFFGDLETT